MKNDEAIKVVRPFGPSIARVKIPNDLIEILNSHVDKIISDEKKTKDLDLGSTLEGSVTQELKLENDFITSSGYHKFLSDSVYTWIKLSENKEIKKFDLINSWIVRQFQNEYNPIHYHSGSISGVGYLKMPKNLNKGKKKSKTNGTIDFIHGSRSLLNKSIFNHKPKVGDMIIFPNYLMHTAYPFNVDGERRSFSFNLEIDKKTLEKINE